MTDFAPTADWAQLRLRARLLSQLRGFFSQHQFLEVETPLLSSETVHDHEVEPFAVPLGEAETWWLQTSPEAHMKRLMAAGGQAIYQITRSFRQGERGPAHNPEFTIVEWYRRDDSMHAGMEFLSKLVAELLDAELAEPISYAKAFQQYVGINPHAADVDALGHLAGTLDIPPAPEPRAMDRDAWLNWLLVACVEPRLGRQRPAILYDYPASQPGLACIAGQPTPVAKRFELYYQGLELANGYYELRDAETLRQRTQQQQARRQAVDKQPLTGPGRLLAAMEHGLPECTGVALGFDRLVMLAAGARTIDEVLAFPIERA